MDKNLKIAPVHVLKDNFGYWNPSTPAIRNIPCGAKFVKSELLYIATAGDNCGSYVEGTTAQTASSNTIATVKVDVPNMGAVWIEAADYDTLVATCNACCV